MLSVLPSASAQPPASATASARASRPPALWADDTEAAIGNLGDWTNKVELADIDADGDVDILLANGGDYETPGVPVPTRALINDGRGRFADRSTDVLGPTPNLARVVKARDVDADGRIDLIVGNTYQTQTRLFLGRGGLTFEEATATHLPKAVASVGDLEIGDIDADGDLDMVLADWGEGNPMQGAVGAPIVWLAGADGRFAEAPDGTLPDVTRGFSWDIELLDVDNDLDLDILESCKVCNGGLLLHNDGTGRFADATASLPQSPNNYEYEPMDLDGDGFLDVVTINDNVDFTEHLLRGDGSGGFVDATGDLWPADANVSGDDNVVVFLDVESDGDADFVIGALDVPDRLLINDGDGRLSLQRGVFDGPATPGTLGMAIADLDGDRRLDVVQAQGEAATQDTVHRGVAIAPDTAVPTFPLLRRTDQGLVARVTDHGSSPTVDLVEVVLEVGVEQRPMQWFGESLWRAELGDETAKVCATDRAGNRACSEDVPA
jgi:hypothetical protein